MLMLMAVVMAIDVEDVGHRVDGENKDHYEFDCRIRSPERWVYLVGEMQLLLLLLLLLLSWLLLLLSIFIVVFISFITISKTNQIEVVTKKKDNSGCGVKVAFIKMMSKNKIE